MTSLQSKSGVALMALACSCAAAPNPKPTNEPAPWHAPANSKPSEAHKAVAAEPDAVKSEALRSGAVTPDSAHAGTGALPDTNTSTVAAAKSSVAAPTTPEEPIVALVAGQPVYVSELLSQWMYLDNFRVLDQLRNLAMSRLVLAEATRLRVRIDPDSSSRAYDAAVAAIENEIKNSEIGRKSPTLTLDGYVDRVMGLDPIRYRERLREDALRSLLGERVTRAWMLQQEHAHIHVIVLGSEGDVELARNDLALGQSFEEVAAQRSIDPSKKDGGAITPIVKGNTPLSKLAFETPLGAVGGPVNDAGAWLLLRVDDRPKPLEGDWSRIGAAVEDSLKKRPVEPLEVKQWHAAMLERYEVDLQPFLDLVHEPHR